MHTASWSTYAGPGRIGLSPAPAGTPRGYRIAPAALFWRTPASATAIRVHLAGLDPRAVSVELHALTYPHTPVLMGDAAAGLPSLRTAIAMWLAFHLGEPVAEIDPSTYRPRKVRPRVAALGLAAMLMTAPAAGAAEMQTVTDPESGCTYFTFQGGLAPRLRRDGFPDCPNAGGIMLQDQTVRDLTREVTTLRREVEALRRR